MATYTLTGTAGNDTKSFTNVGGQPSSGNTYNIDLLAGTDTFRFDEGTTGKYISRFQSTGFTIGTAVNGVITVTGASTYGSRFTFNFTNVETLVFGDKSVTLSYGPADTTPPLVSTYSPTSGATAAAESANIVLTFNESIQKGSGTIEIRSGSATGTVVESFNAATNTANLTFSGSTLTINPTSDLSSNTHYFVVLPSGSVKDLAGNSYAGTSTYDFTTGDSVAPTVATFSPASGGTGAAESANIVLTFNEAIQKGSGTIEIRSGSATGTIVESFNAATNTANLTFSGSTLTINPTSNLSSSTHYYVVLPSGSVKDLAGNSYAGTSTYDFTTGDTISPVFSSGATGSVDENAATSTVVYTAAATDAGGSTITYSLGGTDASQLSINSATGAVTLKASADYETKSSYSFDVVASDGIAAHNVTKAVTVSVNNLNDNPPVFTSGSTGSVDENSATTTVIYTAAATDADGNTLTYSLGGTDAALLNIDSSTGAVTLKASADYESKSSYSFDVIAGDGIAAHNTTKAVMVSVNNLNDNPPVFTSGSTGVVVNDNPAGTVAYTAVATDADGSTLVYSLTGTDAALLNIDSATGQVTLKSTANYSARQSYSFNAVASDGSNTISKAVTVIVQPVNDVPPVFSSGSTGSVDENAAISTVVYQASATDADGNTLSFALSGTDAALLNIDSSTGAVTLKTSADYETKSSYSFDIIASDGLDPHDASKSVTVSVNNLNDNAPVFTSGTTAALTDKAPAGTIAYKAVATDADGGALAYALGGTDASLLNIDSITGEVTLKTSADFQTKPSYSFDVTASDGLHVTTQSVGLTVSNTFSLDGLVNFWKQNTTTHADVPLSGVTTSLEGIVESGASSGQIIEFRNVTFKGDGSHSVEIWVNTGVDIESVQFKLNYPGSSTAVWQSADLLSQNGWTTIRNLNASGVCEFGTMGLNKISAGAFKLGTLTVGASTSADSFFLNLESGFVEQYQTTNTVNALSHGITMLTANSGVSATDGTISLSEILPASYGINCTKTVDASVSRAVTSSDALAALKMSVGINPNGDGTTVSNYQYLASDVNKDGKITSADALSILKMAVHLNSAPSQGWLFVQKSIESLQMSKTNVDWSAASLQVNVTGDQHVDLVGIVKGDVNGNWAP